MKRNQQKDMVPNKDGKDTKGEDGFTIMEVLVVLAIMVILMGVVGSQLTGNVDKAKIVAAKSQAKTLRLALDSYKFDVGRYPTQAEGLDVLVTPPADDDGTWYGPYLEGDVPKDPWKFDFIYEAPQTLETGRPTLPKVISLGADNAPGGKGNNADISS